MALQLKEGETTHLFSLDVAIRNLTEGVVGVRVREGSNAGPIVDEFDVRAGGGVVRSSTAPSFGLSVIEIYDLNEFFGPDCGPSRPAPLR